MSKVLVTGSGGLVGSEAVRHFCKLGYDVVGIDNDLRRWFFGAAASTRGNTYRMMGELGDGFEWESIDIRDREAVERIVKRVKPELVIHTAAQPAHDWAAKDPHTDFAVNAVGTLNLLEAVRQHSIDATFVHCSTSKVYGDNPNFLPLSVVGDRLELPSDHPYFNGIDTTMSIDGCTHSLFGASKASGDLLVQEYGRYFDMPTVCFRPGCISGPEHQGAQLHGFLSYLMRCTMTGKPYTVIGYDGKQVRCNIHAADLVAAFEAFHCAPRPGGAVYNIGGGREASCSMIEAIRYCEEITGKQLDQSYDPIPRIGDHRWWISNNAAFRDYYPEWGITYDVPRVLREIYEHNAERW